MARIPTGAAGGGSPGRPEPTPPAPGISEFDAGFLVGILVGEGHFGGDGRQPHVTLRMHVDHESVFRWLMVRFPDSRLYGPYDHSGRRYYQWMARGAFLRERLLPILEAYLTPDLDGRVWDRFQQMRAAYPGLVRPRIAAPDPVEPPDVAGAATAASGVRGRL